MSCPVACAKAAWICGDLECATGLPMTAYLSMPHFRPVNEEWTNERTAQASRPAFHAFTDGSVRFQCIRLRERPRPRDVQDVGVAADVRRKRREGPGHLDDPDRCRIKDATARRAVDL